MRYADVRAQAERKLEELGVAVDLTGLQIVQIAIDTLVIPDAMPFWRAVLGYRDVDDDDLLRVASVRGDKRPRLHRGRGRRR